MCRGISQLAVQEGKRLVVTVHGTTRELDLCARKYWVKQHGEREGGVCASCRPIAH